MAGSYFNEAGEPLMTASQMWAEQAIDEMNAWDDLINDDFDYHYDYEEAEYGS